MTGASTALFKDFARLVPISLLVLNACSTSPQGRTHIITPAPVSDVYSEADMQMQLATVSSINTPCVGVECERNHEFDQRVQALGARLAVAAFESYPDLNKRISHFKFEVAEKADVGSTSNAGGKVIVFRGIQNLEFDDTALAFLIAREMGHVVGQHHDENSATKILLSIAAGVLFPALNLFSSSTAVAQATSATSATTLGSTVVTTAATTATSYLGSKVVLASLKPDQLSEADIIGLSLLESQGWSLHEVASALNGSTHVDAGNSWKDDFRLSAERVKALDEEAEAAAYHLGVESLALQVAQEEQQIDDSEPMPDIPALQEDTDGGPADEPANLSADEKPQDEVAGLPLQADATVIAAAPGGWEPPAAGTIHASEKLPEKPLLTVPAKKPSAGPGVVKGKNTIAAKRLTGKVRGKSQSAGSKKIRKPLSRPGTKPATKSKKPAGSRPVR